MATITEGFKLEVTSEYILSMGSALFLTILTMLASINIGKLRREYFTEEFQEKNFGEEHRKAFGPNQKPAKGGYPDVGDGRYSDKLTYEQWHKFNNAQRAHQNSLEQLPMFLTAILVGGQIFPKLSALVGLLICVGRIQYIRGYASKGPNGRVIGALMSLLSGNGMIITTLVASLYYIFNPESLRS